jgi:hypothetical protein
MGATNKKKRERNNKRRNNIAAIAIISRIRTFPPKPEPI